MPCQCAASKQLVKVRQSSPNNISTIKPAAPRALASHQIPRIARQFRMMYHMRPIDRIDRWHPVVQPKWEILVEQVCRFVRAVDGVEGEGGRADGDVQISAHADG